MAIDFLALPDVDPVHWLCCPAGAGVNHRDASALCAGAGAHGQHQLDNPHRRTVAPFAVPHRTVICIVVTLTLSSPPGLTSLYGVQSQMQTSL